MIYADANVIIRLMEGLPEARSAIEHRLRAPNIVLCTSLLSRLECRCRPLREGNNRLLDVYEGFFNSKELTVIPIDGQVIDKATELRARLGLKTPDAIRLASAIIIGAETFLSGDHQLERCSEIAFEIV